MPRGQRAVERKKWPLARPGEEIDPLARRADDRPHLCVDLPTKEIVRLYRSGMLPATIARRFHCKLKAIERCLGAAGEASSQKARRANPVVLTKRKVPKALLLSIPQPGTQRGPDRGGLLLRITQKEQRLLAALCDGKRYHRRNVTREFGMSDRNVQYQLTPVYKRNRIDTVRFHARVRVCSAYALGQFELMDELPQSVKNPKRA